MMNSINLKNYKNIIIFFISQIIMLVSLSFYNINIYLYFVLVFISFSSIIISNSILFEEINNLVKVKKQESDSLLLEVNRKNYEINNKITSLERSVLRKMYHDYNKHKTIIVAEVYTESDFIQQQEYKNKIVNLYSSLLNDENVFCDEDRFNTLFQYYDFLINVSVKRVNIKIKSFKLSEECIYETFMDFFDKLEAVRNSNFKGDIIIENTNFTKVESL